MKIQKITFIRETLKMSLATLVAVSLTNRINKLLGDRGVRTNLYNTRADNIDTAKEPKPTTPRCNSGEMMNKSRDSRSGCEQATPGNRILGFLLKAAKWIFPSSDRMYSRETKSWNKK